MKAAPNQNRKIIYGLLIVALFGVMYPYSDWLNEEKRQKDLGEAAIGQIDTGSFMLKLALLGGARGIAANVLWTRTEELKREQDWDSLATTVDFITKLQPHFLSVWTFQGWNLAYNVSVEWDAPEDKYQWIKKGITFLQEGVSKNKRSPDLIWDTAWTYYHKIGFSDEAIILRRLFRDDDDEAFKTYVDYSDAQRTAVVGNDNFKLGYGWFNRAIDLVDSGATRLQEGTREEVEVHPEAGASRGKSRAADQSRAQTVYVDPTPQRKGRPGDLAFRSMPAHAQTRYSAALEKMSMVDVPATFGEVAKNEWRRALNEWIKFGEYEYMTHNEVIVDGKMTRMPVYIDDDTKPEKLKAMHENQRYWTNRWSDQMNYPYWKDRAASEMTTEGVLARQLFYEGTLAYKKSDFEKAVQKYRDGLDIWKKLLDKHPDYRGDDLNKKDTGLVVKRYVRALRQLGVPEPKDLPFKELLAGAEQDTTLDPFDATEMMTPHRKRRETVGPRDEGERTDCPDPRSSADSLGLLAPAPESRSVFESARRAAASAVSTRRIGSPRGETVLVYLKDQDRDTSTHHVAEFVRLVRPVPRQSAPRPPVRADEVWQSQCQK